jgi:thiol-disulfide isomerase/thioredoxin
MAATADAGAVELVRLRTPEPVVDIAFQDASGQQRRLSDYRGRPVVLNLWATWCLPCVTELPALDKLAQDFKDRGPAVLALSIDRKGAAAVQAFFARNAIRHLEPLVDPAREAAAILKVTVLPTTLFLDAQGREVGARHTGPLDWNDPPLRAALTALLRPEGRP